MTDDLDDVTLAPKRDRTVDRLLPLWKEPIPPTTPVHAADAPLYWLVDQYRQPYRAYHNISHIERMFTVWKEVVSGVPVIDSQAVALAIWFHDAIYDPKRRDNEEQSAEEAIRRLAPLGIGEETLTRVRRMILATAAHQTDSMDVDTALLLDLDLAILGAEGSEYDAYSRAIREEYVFVSDDDFRSGRTQVLRRFLDRPRIYSTEPMYIRYEAQARQNIAREIAALEGAK